MAKAHQPFLPQPPGITFMTVEGAEQVYEGYKRDYLRRWGWEETCSTPGSFWLWKRDFADYDKKMRAIHRRLKLPGTFRPYGVISAPTDLAISMTLNCLDEQLEMGDIDD